MPALIEFVKENCLLDKEIVVAVVVDNVLIYENKMKDNLDDDINSNRYNSYTTETTLEFTKNVKEVLEVTKYNTKFELASCLILIASLTF